MCTVSTVYVLVIPLACTYRLIQKSLTQIIYVALYLNWYKYKWMLTDRRCHSYNEQLKKKKRSTWNRVEWFNTAQEVNTINGITRYKSGLAIWCYLLIVLQCCYMVRSAETVNKIYDMLQQKVWTVNKFEEEKRIE